MTPVEGKRRRQDIQEARPGPGRATFATRIAAGSGSPGPDPSRTEGCCKGYEGTLLKLMGLNFDEAASSPLHTSSMWRSLDSSLPASIRCRTNSIQYLCGSEPNP